MCGWTIVWPLFKQQFLLPRSVVPPGPSDLQPPGHLLTIIPCTMPRLIHVSHPDTHFPPVSVVPSQAWWSGSSELSVTLSSRTKTRELGTMNRGWQIAEKIYETVTTSYSQIHSNTVWTLALANISAVMIHKFLFVMYLRRYISLSRSLWRNIEIRGQRRFKNHIL